MAAWERQLPEFDAICGVPRSGLIPAAYIATRRNIRMVPLNELLRQPEGAIERSPLRDVNPASVYNKPYSNRLLIVDDSSSNASVTFTDLRERLSRQTSLQISYGAVYRASEHSKVDHSYREVSMPRMFGWNWYRHAYLKHAMLDMDGVICEDWKQRSEVDQDPEFVRHLHEAKPLYIPDCPVRAIVTSRIERYRPQTVAWLTKHRVKYNQLIMHPAETPEKRRAAHDHAIRKATAYRQDPYAVLFVESDERQAAQIFELTQNPVLCVDTMTMLSRKE
jgi:uncharacterized HAD superfamily protein